MSLASLPMYDWPELRSETDALWRAMRDAIRARGIDAPDTLDRGRDNEGVWTDSSLVLSQTCGMPWRLGLHRNAALIVTPDYGVEGCPPGYYCSTLVVRADDNRETVSDFAGATCAFNSEDSQSGYAAMREAVADTAFSNWLKTGAHAASISAVADGRADIAAIDAVTWRLAKRFQPGASRLRVLSDTAPTPALPYITSKNQNADALAGAVADAIASLNGQTRAALGLVGCVKIPSEDYLRVRH